MEKQFFAKAIEPEETEEELSLKCRISSFVSSLDNEEVDELLPRLAGSPDFDQFFKGVREACKMVNFHSAVFCAKGLSLEDDEAVAVFAWEWYRREIEEFASKFVKSLIDRQLKN